MQQLIDKNTGVFYATLTNLCFASNFTFLALIFSGNTIAPLVVNFFRTTCAMLFFVTYVLWNRSYINSIQKQDWILFILCALLGMSINQILFMDGMSKTSTIHASTIALSTPFLAITLQYIFFRGTLAMHKMQWLGIFLGFMGAAFLISKQDVSGKASMEGDMEILTNFIFFAFFLVLSKRLTKRYNPVFMLMVFFSISLPVIWAFSIPDMLETSWLEVPISAYLGIAGTVIFGTVLSHLFNMKAVKRLSPSIVSVFLYIQPIIASFFAIIFFGELLTKVNVLSFFLVGTGLYLVAIRRYKKTAN